MFEGWSRRSGAAPAACWVTAQVVKFSNPQPRIVGSPPKIVRFSNQASWVTAPLAPGGAGRQRERLLWSCCDQGSAPQGSRVAELATKAGGRGPPGMLPSWCDSTLERWWGARALHLLLLKACCLRNNRCTQVGRQGQRTRSTLS